MGIPTFIEYILFYMITKCWVLRCSFLLFFLVFAICAEAQKSDFIFDRGKHKFEIPFEYKNDFIIVDLYFNDVFPLKFIFDTGAEHTVLIKREIADLFQIDYTRRFTLYGADMKTQLFAYLAPGISLRVNKIKAVDRSILVLDEDYLNFQELTGVNIHGILGADFFRRFIVEINYRKQRIILHDPNHYIPPKKKFIEVPLDIYRNKPYINANVLISKNDGVNVKLLLDTGASLALMLYTTTHPDLMVPEKVLNTNIGMGLGGYIEGYIGRIELFDFYDFKLNNVITNYQEFQPQFDSTFLNDRNGLLGNLLLKKFDIIIDYVSNKLYLNPNKNYKEKFTYDKSGLIIAAGGDNLRQFSILKVIEKTPAGEAGLKKGDEIKNFNGWPASFISLGKILKVLKSKPGRTIKMKIQRGDKKIKVQFKLRDLI